MSQNCLRCGNQVSEENTYCPSCGLHLGKVKKTLGDFLPPAGLHLKIQNTLTELFSQQITNDELGHRLILEWQLVEALLEKYRNIQLPELAQASALIVEALEIYQQALLALGEEGDSEKSLNLAREADDRLVEFDRIKEWMEVRYLRAGMET